MRRLWMIGAALLVLLPSTPGAAQSVNQQVERLSAEGSTAYSAGRFADAAEKFGAAYQLYPDSTLLYNIARCHQGLGNFDKAIEYYQRFLQQPTTAAHLAAKARSAIRTLEDVKRNAAAAPPVKRGTLPGSEKPAPPMERKPVPLWAWITLGGGAAAAITGAIVLGLGAKDHSDVTGAAVDANGIKQVTQQRAADLAASGTTKKTAGIAVLGVGAALAAVALGYIIFGRPMVPVEERSTGWRVDIAAGPGEGMALLRKKF